MYPRLLGHGPLLSRWASVALRLRPGRCKSHGPILSRWASSALRLRLGRCTMEAIRSLPTSSGRGVEKEKTAGSRGSRHSGVSCMHAWSFVAWSLACDVYARAAARALILHMWWMFMEQSHVRHARPHACGMHATAHASSRSRPLARV